MINRRGLLRGLGLAAALAPIPGWAAAGDPAWLAAAQDGAGYSLGGIGADGRVRFTLPLPGRGHAAAAHPHRAEAVAFARRPGTWALVLDCSSGRAVASLASPLGRHFYGHGAFSGDGRWLYTTENRYDTGEGRIGIWDAAHGYTRVGDLPSGGIGPHEIRRVPGAETLVVANGGLRTHPDQGRANLNLTTMRPNLSLIDPGAGLVAQVESPPEWRQASIRHIALAPDGTVAAALQWEGEPTDSAPLMAIWRPGAAALEFPEMPTTLCLALKGYAASVAIDGGGAHAAITGPKGGVVVLCDLASARMTDTWARGDVCGIAPALGPGFVVSDGLGGLTRLIPGPGGPQAQPLADGGPAWDNHLVALTQA